MELRHVAVPAFGQPARDDSLELGGELGMRLPVGVEPLAPLCFELLAALDAAAEVPERLLGNVERLQ